jgi:hypothetical protein
MTYSILIKTHNIHLAFDVSSLLFYFLVMSVTTIETDDHSSNDEHFI